MTVLGYVLATLVGLSLGVMGGGGSILPVPIFVYVLGYDPKLAIAMSLPVVGVTSLVGAWGHWKAGNVDVKAAGMFGVIALVTTTCLDKAEGMLSKRVARPSGDTIDRPANDSVVQ